MAECKPPSKFQLGKKDKLNAVLGEDKGSGWEAHFVRNIEVCIQRIPSCLYILNRQFDFVYFLQKITKGIIHYNSDSKDDLKKDVCDLKSYPPFVECVVQCTREALEGGRKRRVNLVFNKMQTGLEVTRHNAFISFACITFSKEPIGGGSWLRCCELCQYTIYCLRSYCSYTA